MSHSDMILHAKARILSMIKQGRFTTDEFDLTQYNSGAVNRVIASLPSLDIKEITQVMKTEKQYLFYDLQHRKIRVADNVNHDAIVDYNNINDELYGKKPSSVELICKTAFGKPNLNTSFTGEANFWTTFAIFSKSGYLSDFDFMKVRTTHKIMGPMLEKMKEMSTINFQSLREIDTNYATYKEVPQEKLDQFTACSLYYNLHLGSVQRFMGNNYINAHVDPDYVRKKCKGIVPEKDLNDLYRVMKNGSPALIQADVTYENLMEYYRYQNHSTVETNPEKIKKSIVKEFKYCWIFLLPFWFARFVPNSHITPHGLVSLPGKNDRIVFDGSCLLHAFSKCLNMFTHKDNEPQIHYQWTLINHLIRLWNLRISYPWLDILQMADDVTGAFRIPKYNPEILSGFLYLLLGFLCVSVGQNFGCNFSPSNFEPFAKVREYMAKHFFGDESLLTKHKTFLDQVRFDISNPNPGEIVQAIPCSQNKGVLDESGNPEPTPHHMFVDDNMIADISKKRMLLALAAGFEAIFLLCGFPNEALRRLAIAMDKLLSFVCTYKVIILGLEINTRSMTIMRDPKKLDILHDEFKNKGKWNRRRQQFQLKELASLLGRLEDMARHIVWAKALYLNIRTSVKGAYFANKGEIMSDKKYSQLIGDSRYEGVDENMLLRQRFANSKLEKAMWNHRKTHNMTRGLKQDLALLREFLNLENSFWRVPISHIVPRDPDFQSHGDACLDGGGGWSASLMFWWYLSWPEKVTAQTMKNKNKFRATIRNPDPTAKEKFISINLLEYVVAIINYAVASFIVSILLAGGSYGNIDLRNKFPVLENFADNTSAVKWLMNACSSNEIGKALSRIYCALAFGNPLGTRSSFIAGVDNKEADGISRFKSNLVNCQFEQLKQVCPGLHKCKRIRLSQRFILLLTEALLQPRKLQLSPNQLQLSEMFEPIKGTS